MTTFKKGDFTMSNNSVTTAASASRLASSAAVGSFPFLWSGLVLMKEATAIGDLSSPKASSLFPMPGSCTGAV